MITSQIDTAPKPAFADSLVIDGLITSQIDTAPKPVDVASIATNNAAFGVIACHDGSIIKFAPSDNRYLGYNMADLEAVDKAVNRIIASKRLRGAQESEYLSTIEAEAGVTIERFVVC